MGKILNSLHLIQKAETDVIDIGDQESAGRPAWQVDMYFYAKIQLN